MNDCAEIRRMIDETLDGPVPAELRHAVSTHLGGCSECRDYRQGQDAVRAGLRALPPAPFPDEALDAVWNRTIRAHGRSVAAPRHRAAWRLAAAAAVLLTALLLPALFHTPRRPYTTADLARADREARLVLALAGQALRRTRSAAATQVIAGEVAPAMRKIPIRWPSVRRFDS